MGMKVLRARIFISHLQRISGITRSWSRSLGGPVVESGEDVDFRPWLKPNPFQFNPDGPRLKQRDREHHVLYYVFRDLLKNKARALRVFKVITSFRTPIDFARLTTLLVRPAGDKAQS